MRITPLQQAECANRSNITRGPDPSKWIVPALPAGWELISFHFHVEWDNNTPLSLHEKIWMTRQVAFDMAESPLTASPSDLLQLFSTGSDLQYFLLMDAVCKHHGQSLAAILLPDIPVSHVNDATPVWAVYLDTSRALQIHPFTVRKLKAVIQRRAGGPVWMGKKGLTLGTSAVECALSKTDAAYPGDVDAVIVDDQGLVRYVVEFKKHNVNGPIGDHLMTQYFSGSDEKKYRRLSLLVDHYRQYNEHVELIVFYYATSRPELRFQIVEVPIGDFPNILHDSNDFSILNLTERQAATMFTDWVASFSPPQRTSP